MAKNYNIGIVKHALVFIAIFIFLSNLVLPSFSIINDFPRVEPVDFFLPFIFLHLILHVNNVFIKNVFIKLIPILFFLLIIFLAILINNRIGSMRDLFEIFKILKFILIIYLFALVAPSIRWRTWINASLILVILFNFLHYFDFLNFNQYIQIYYGSEIQISYFGVDTLGNPATKRILGTVGNPNNNAILFLFFVIYFIPTVKNNFPYFFYLSSLGVIASQSRTGFIAFFIIIILGFIILTPGIKKITTHFLILIIEYLLMFVLGNVYIGSLADPELLKSNSVMGRLETWRFLGKMILDKPFFGYGPDKLFFEQRNLYSESEYFLITWRYGFFGLLMYLWVLTNNIFKSVKNIKSHYSIILFLFTLVFLITGITNTPFADPKLMVLYAICMGWFISEEFEFNFDNQIKS